MIPFNLCFINSLIFYIDRVGEGRWLRIDGIINLLAVWRERKSWSTGNTILRAVKWC